MTTSLTIKGIAITLLSWLFIQADIQIGTSEVTVFVQVLAGIMQLGGLAMAYIGRLRHGDISLFGKKK